jgi:hypothetical protein
MARQALSRTPAIALAAVALACSSCGQKQQPLYPVRGQVFFAGKPAPGAKVVFHPVGGDLQSPKPSGSVQDDGSFTLSTHPLGEGAPPGEYLVAVVWLDAGRRRGDGVIANKLPGRYAQPQSSGLKATVADGPTDVPPFQLK